MPACSHLQDYSCTTVRGQIGCPLLHTGSRGVLEKLISSRNFLQTMLVGFFWDREPGSELSRVSGCRVKSTTLPQHLPAGILKGLAGIGGPARAGVGVHGDVLPTAVLEVAELKPRT